MKNPDNRIFTYNTTEYDICEDFITFIDEKNVSHKINKRLVIDIIQELN